MNKSVIFIDETAQLGGAEINLLTIASGLKSLGWHPQAILAEPGPLTYRLQEKSIPFVLVSGCPHWSVSFYLWHRIKIPNPIAWLMNLVGGIFWIFRLWNVLKVHHSGIVHTNSLKAHLFGGIAGRLAGHKVVWHFQDIVEKNSGWGIYRKVLWLFARICADQILCISPQVESQFQETSHLQDRTYLLWNTIDTQNFTPSMPEVSDCWCSSGIRIGSAARIMPWKGQAIALQAARWLKEHSVPFHWVFAGDIALGSERYLDYLNNLVRAWNLDDCVDLIGWVSEMPDFYRSLDIFVHIPTEIEPFGLTVVEAMACGVPVVATPGGASNQFVVSGGGWLVDAGDAVSVGEIIADIWKSPEEYKLRSHSAVACVLENFNLPRYLSELIHIYESLYSYDDNIS